MNWFATLVRFYQGTRKGHPYDCPHVNFGDCYVPNKITAVQGCDANAADYMYVAGPKKIPMEMLPVMTNIAKLILQQIKMAECYP